MEKVLKKIGLKEEIAENQLKILRKLLQSNGINIKGIKGSVWLIALSPGIKFIASSGYSNKIFIWNICKQKIKSILKLNNLIVGFSFYSEYELIIILECGKVYFMNFKIGQKFLLANFITSIELARFSVNYVLGFIIAIGKSGDLYLFDLHTQSISRIVKIYKKSAKAIVASQLSKTVYFTADTYIISWNIEKNCENFKLAGHTKAVSLLALPKNEESLISASIDSTLIIWDLSTEQIVFKRISDDTIQHLIWSNSQKFYISSEKNLKIWDAETNRLINTFTSNTGSSICLALAPDDSILIAGSLGGFITMWDLNSKSCIGILKNEAKVKKMLFCKNFQEFLTLGNYGNVFVWNVEQKKIVNRFEANEFVEEIFIVDERRVAFVKRNRQAIFYNVESWEKVKMFKVNIRNNFKINCFIGDGFIVTNSKEIQFWKDSISPCISKTCNNEISSLCVCRSKRYVVLNFFGLFCEVWIKVN